MTASVVLLNRERDCLPMESQANTTCGVDLLVSANDSGLSQALLAEGGIIGTAHHHLGAFEVHLVVNMPGDVITIIRQGEFVLPLLVEAFDVLDRRLEEHSRVMQQRVIEPGRAPLPASDHGNGPRLHPWSVAMSTSMETGARKVPKGSAVRRPARCSSTRATPTAVPATEARKMTRSASPQPR